jgi:molecular chaperone GrpE (heat shock protein)
VEENNSAESNSLTKKSPESKPKSPAEAFLEMQSSFKELYAGVSMSSNQLEQLFGMTAEIKQKLLTSNEVILQQGKQSALEVIFRTYNSLFRLAKSIKKGADQIQSIMDGTASDLNLIGISIISPQLGAILNHNEMVAVEITNKSKLKIDQSIVDIQSCGFIGGNNVLLKAQVTIFKESK